MTHQEREYYELLNVIARPAPAVEAAVLSWCRDEYESLTYPYCEIDRAETGFRCEGLLTDEEVLAAAKIVARIERLPLDGAAVYLRLSTRPSGHIESRLLGHI